MGDHLQIEDTPGSSTASKQFNFSQPGPNNSHIGPVYGAENSNQTGLEDIPDVEAYERSLAAASAAPNYGMANVADFKPILTLDSKSPREKRTLAFNGGLKLITPKMEVIDDSPMISPASTSTRVMQRSGVKMEMPPYPDPDAPDDEPEDGVTYPEPDLFDVKNTNMTEYDLDVMKLGKQVVDEARKKIEVPDASAPPNKIVEYLMYYRSLKESELLQLNAYRTKRNRLSLNLVKNNVDREFDQKACESLVKKLKDKKHDLQNLIDVVLSKGTKYTGCITIPRTLDGRLQVHGKKGFPHVVYGKLWRFSEMTKNETRHVDHCKHAFEMKSDMVCVNPYHYEVVVGAMIVGQRDSHDARGDIVRDMNNINNMNNAANLNNMHQRLHSHNRQNSLEEAQRFMPPAPARQSQLTPLAPIPPSMTPMAIHPPPPQPPIHQMAPVPLAQLPPPQMPPPQMAPSQMPAPPMTPQHVPNNFNQPVNHQHQIQPNQGHLNPNQFTMVAPQQFDINAQAAPNPISQMQQDNVRNVHQPHQQAAPQHHQPPQQYQHQQQQRKQQQQQHHQLLFHDQSGPSTSGANNHFQPAVEPQFSEFDAHFYDLFPNGPDVYDFPNMMPHQVQQVQQHQIQQQLQQRQHLHHLQQQQHHYQIQQQQLAQQQAQAQAEAHHHAQLQAHAQQQYHEQQQYQEQQQRLQAEYAKMREQYLQMQTQLEEDANQPGPAPKSEKNKKGPRGEEIVPAYLLNREFVGLATFRNFCRRTFGTRFFEGEKEDCGMVMPSSGHPFIEALQSPLLGVKVIKRRMRDDDTIEQNNVPDDAPYHDLCNFILKLTSETIIMTKEEPEPAERTEQWATIVVYEGLKKVGEKRCARGNFHVDGGFISSENRYSLGLIGNPEREPEAYKIRRAIIDGVRFSHKKDGSIWLQNYMVYPIFVTSGYLDEQSGGMIEDKVHKLYGTAKLKVFGFDVSKRIIRDALMSKQMATMYLQGTPTPMDSIYKKMQLKEIQREACRTTDSLVKYCCIKLSFCKGFGSAYPERPNVWDCPVWLDMKVNMAYDYMDAICNDISNRFEPLGMEDFKKLGLNVDDDD